MCHPSHFKVFLSLFCLIEPSIFQIYHVVASVRIPSFPS